MNIAHEQFSLLPDRMNMDGNQDGNPQGVPGGATTQIHGGLGGMVDQNVQQGSDGELSSVSSCKANKGKAKSGMLACPSENTKNVEVWPHYNLHYEYASKPLEYNDLLFEQYIARETRTISACTDALEAKGRLNLMFRLAHLKQKGYSWESLRGLYTAVVRGIEMHETNWAADWQGIEEMVIDVTDRNVHVKNKSKKQNDVWFCREFNREEGCALQPPHEAMVNRK